jgi:uroporphyrinogen-III synthase
MASLLSRCGAVPCIAPSLREVPLESNLQAIEFARDVAASSPRVDVLICLTGVGTRTLFEAACTAVPRDELVAALNRLTVIVRGPKPVVVLKEWDVHIDLRAPEPNTWREIISVIDGAPLDLRGRKVVVQEYGQPTPELYAALEQRGAAVRPVHVYNWDLPDDLAPLHHALRRTIAGDFDVLMFTSAQQVRNVLAVAATRGIEAEFRSAAANCLLASIGPTTTETLLECGLPRPFEPSHGKMGHLVTEACRHVREQLDLSAGTR